MRVLQIIFVSLFISGLIGCVQAEPSSPEVDLEQKIDIEGPAFVLFFTDP